VAERARVPDDVDGLDHDAISPAICPVSNPAVAAEARQAAFRALLPTSAFY
jgi:hypothetical protein